jgi:hypothetical protein
VIALAVVNLIGSGITTNAIARWHNTLDLEKVWQVVREQRGEARPKLQQQPDTAEVVETQS